VHKNGIDTVIQSLPLLPDSVTFRVYGTGPDEKKLHSLARVLGVENRVAFLGHREHHLLPVALHDADIFIRPSRSEGMGNSFIEAMAAGLPVIATQEGGISDFLFDAKRNPDCEPTGWAVDKDSPKQIARAVEDILAHPGTVRKVAETAYKLVRENYDWNTLAERMRFVFG
jgi:phosphatidylinositol alpha-1,6-mannosyltransferase